MKKQLARIGLDYDHPKAKLFPAANPDTAGGFANIGTHGCFLSHLNVLKNARIEGHDCILILEDDVDFTPRFCGITKTEASLMEKASWDIFYLGSQHIPDETTEDDHGFFISALPASPHGTAHATLLRKTTLLEMIPYLETMLARKAGDALGGPMPIDAAYNRFRKEHPNINTVVTKTQWITQHTSRTQKQDTGWKDYIPLISMARQIKNKFSHR